MVRNIGLLMLIISLLGCSIGMKKVELKPSDLEGKGLLVARINSSNFSKKFSYVSFGGDVYLNDKKYSKALYYHYLVMPLDPGQYNFEKIGDITGLSMPGTYMMKSYSNLPINRTFTIKPGRITNLGYIVAHYTNVSEERYKIYTIDNSKHMAAYLRKEQAAAYNSLHNKSILLATGKYLSSSDLIVLRKNIALQSANRVEFKDKQIVSGALGVVARIYRNTNNQISRVTLIETETFDAVDYCSENKFQYACIISEGENIQMLIGRFNGKPRFKSLPKGVEKAKLHVFGKHNILIIDDSFNLYVSKDNGKSFSVNSSFKLPEPEAYMNYAKIYRGKKGFYIEARKENGRLIYKSHDNNVNFKLLSIPKGIKPDDIYETKKGIVMGPIPGIAISSEVYYLSNGSNVWSEVKIPSTLCMYIDILNYNTGKLKMECGGQYAKHHYLSKDGGVTWSKL